MRQILALFLLLPSLAFTYPLIPDDAKTPGELCTEKNPDFTEYRYKEKIPYCGRSVSSSLKQKIYEDYKIPKEERTMYTIDHFIPLSIGGSNGRKNLWPEHKKVKALRSKLEDMVYTEIKAGNMKQKEVVELIVEAKQDPCHYKKMGAEPKGSDACDMKKSDAKE